MEVGPLDAEPLATQSFDSKQVEAGSQITNLLAAHTSDAGLSGVDPLTTYPLAAHTLMRVDVLATEWTEVRFLWACHLITYSLGIGLANIVLAHAYCLSAHSLWQSDIFIAQLLFVKPLADHSFSLADLLVAKLSLDNLSPPHC